MASRGALLPAPTPQHPAPGMETKLTFPWAVLGGEGRRAGTAMGLGLLFLTVLATLGSCEYPGGNNGVFGIKAGLSGCPGDAGTSKERDPRHGPGLKFGSGEGRAGRKESWGEWVLTGGLRGAFGLVPPTRRSLRAGELAGRVVLSPPPSPALPFSPRRRQTRTPTGPAQRPSAWGAARGSTRS